MPIELRIRCRLHLMQSQMQVFRFLGEISKQLPLPICSNSFRRQQTSLNRWMKQEFNRIDNKMKWLIMKHNQSSYNNIISIHYYCSNRPVSITLNSSNSSQPNPRSLFPLTNLGMILNLSKWLLAALPFLTTMLNLLWIQKKGWFVNFLLWIFHMMSNVSYNWEKVSHFHHIIKKKVWSNWLRILKIILINLTSIPNWISEHFFLLSVYQSYEFENISIN